jgi:hypothetical protein
MSTLAFAFLAILYDKWNGNCESRVSHSTIKHECLFNLEMPRHFLMALPKICKAMWQLSNVFCVFCPASKWKLPVTVYWPPLFTMSVIEQVIFVGSGCSSNTPALKCLLQDPPSCKVCLLALSAEGWKNRRNNPSILIRVRDHRDPEGRLR